MSSQALCIIGIEPALGVPGGELTIRCQRFRPGIGPAAQVLLGDVPASIVSASDDRVVVLLPDNPRAPGITLRVDGAQSPIHHMLLASRLAAELHPVTNPVVAPDGSIITTISGSRSQRVSQPLVRVLPSGVPQGCTSSGRHSEATCMQMETLFRCA